METPPYNLTAIQGQWIGLEAIGKLSDEVRGNGLDLSCDKVRGGDRTKSNGSDLSREEVAVHSWFIGICRGSSAMVLACRHSSLAFVMVVLHDVFEFWDFKVTPKHALVWNEICA